MNEFDVLINYLNQEIKKLKEEDSISLLLEQKNLAIDAMNLLDSNIEMLDKDFIYQILLDAYNIDEAKAKYEMFLEIISFAKFLDPNSQVIQIRKSFEFLKSIKELIVQKFNKLEKLIEEKSKSLNEKLTFFTKYLDYFTKLGLTKPLNVLEMDEFYQFLKNSSIDKEIIFNLIIKITEQQINFYEKEMEKAQETEFKKIKRNSRIISRRINQEVKENIPISTLDSVDSVEKIEEPTTLSEEEQQLYEEIKKVYKELSKERKDITSELEAISLLDEKDFTLSGMRKDLYNDSSLGNIWTIILLDLEHNLLKNYHSHKEEIKEIFEYILEKFQKSYVNQAELDTLIKEIPTFTDEEIKSLDILITEYVSLSEDDRNLIDSMYATYEAYGEDALVNFDSNFSNLEIIYYSKIKSLKEELEYFNLQKEAKLVYDKELVHLLIVELKENKNNIIKLLKDTLEIKKQIETFKESKQSREPLNTDELQRESNKNLILFLSTTYYDKNDVSYKRPIVEEDVERIKSNYPSEFAKTLKDIVNNIKINLLGTSFQDFISSNKKGLKRTLEGGKRLSFFDRYHLFRVRRNDTRITYMTIPISENNKKILKQIYHLEELGVIYLTFGIFIEINDSREYISTTHSRLAKEYKKVDYLTNLFATDFTKETLEEAKLLIDESISLYDDLIQKHTKSDDEKLRGGGNDD